MIDIAKFAKDIQSKLEDISYELYGIDEQEDPTDEHPQFNITDDVQIYHNRTLKKNNRRYTPGILRKIPGTINPATNWGVYSTQCQLEIYGYRDERDKTQEIFREFVRQYNGVPYEPETGYNFVQDNKTSVIAFGSLIPDEYEESEDGKNIGSFYAFMDIVVSVFVGGLSAKETSLTIEGISVPFSEIQYKQDKSLIPNIEYKDLTESPNLSNKLIYELLTFNIPLNIDNEVDQLILNRALNPTYNDLFFIEWDLGIGTKSGQYALRSAFIQYNQDNEAVGVLISFESIGPTQEIKIDGSIIPVLEFNFSSVRGTESFNTTFPDGNIEVLQTNVTYSYGIGMTLLYDTSIAALISLREDIIKNNLNTSHTVELLIDGQEVVYDVILTEGTWSFNERANQILQVSFVGEKIF